MILFTYLINQLDSLESLLDGYLNFSSENNFNKQTKEQGVYVSQEEIHRYFSSILKDRKTSPIRPVVPRNYTSF